MNSWKMDSEWAVKGRKEHFFFFFWQWDRLSELDEEQSCSPSKRSLVPRPSHSARREDHRFKQAARTLSPSLLFSEKNNSPRCGPQSPFPLRELDDSLRAGHIGQRQNGLGRTG